MIKLAVVLLALVAGTASGQNTPRIYISGKVTLEDGSPPPQRVQLEEVCGVKTQPQGNTDASGSFAFALGFNPTQAYSSASDSSAAVQSTFGGELADRQGVTQVPGGSLLGLMGCGIRAVLAGYRSDTIDISRERPEVNPNIGTVVLHKAAPKGAQAAYDKGMAKLGVQDFAQAEKELRKAVEQYPKYAEAWDELGSVLEDQKKYDEARKAYLQSVAIDAKFARPHLNLARLGILQGNWQDAADQSDVLIRLESHAYPEGYYFNAVARFNLKDYDKATTSAEQAVMLDVQHQSTDSERLYGTLLSMRGDYAGAAEQFRNYLEHAPSTANVDSVKQMLAKVEAAQKK